MKDFRIIFVHGYTASHLADWYPAISPMLEHEGVEFSVPDLPGGEHPHAADWLDIIDREVKKSDKPFVLVGHSLGTRAALLYLEKFQSTNVRAVFLIAAFANRTQNAQRKNGEAYPDFFTQKLDTGILKNLPVKYYVIHSKDDSSIPLVQGEEIARDLDAKLMPLDGRDHMSEPENASVIFDILRKELQF